MNPLFYKETHLRICWQVFISVTLVLPSVFCLFKNDPEIDVTCASDLMRVRLKFQQPFNGMVYTVDYRWNPACSFQVPPSTDVLDVTLRFPYNSCGTRIQYVPNGRSVISNSIKVQQQRMVQAVNDTVNPVSCTILGLHESFSKTNSNLDESGEQNIEPSLEINMGQEFLGAHLARELNLLNEPILVFRAKNAGKYRDMDVKNCIIHESKPLKVNSLIYQVTQPNECDDQLKEIISSFTLFNTSNQNELVAYARLRFLNDILLLPNVQITCGAQLCRKMCKRRCSKKTSNDFFTAIATHQISKRSLPETEVEQPPLDLRNRLLKATVSILSNKFFQRIRGEKSQNGTFHKRSEDFVNTSADGRQSHQEPLSFENFLKTSSKGQFPESRMSSGSLERLQTEISPFPSQTQVESQNFPKLSKDPQKAEKKLSFKNRILMKDLARKLASRSQKLKEHNEKFKDLIKTAKEENFPLNFPIETPDFPIETPDFPIETSDFSETALTADETTTFNTIEDFPESVSRKRVKHKRSKLNDFEGVETTSVQAVSELDEDEISTSEDTLHETTEPLEDLKTTLAQRDELEQSTDAISITLISVKELTHQPPLVQTISQELFPTPTEVSSTVQDLTEFSVQDNITESVEKSPDTDSTEISNHEKSLLELQNNFKISRTTFIIVTIILGFVIFSLIVTVIGLILYIKKEKKRRAIDNFLLYNFY